MRPEIQQDTHRPPGHHRPREAKSQKAQLESSAVHGTSKGVKRSTSSKTGVPGVEGKRANGPEPEVSLRVQQALDRDINLRGYGLRAEVIDGVARVTGIVDTLAEKSHARELITGVEGVRGYEDGISICTDGKVTDDAVRFEIAEELGRYPELTGKVDVDVVQGVAYLRGNVDSKDQKEIAANAAAKARGVAEVKNELTIGRRRPTTLEEIFHSQVRGDEE